MKEGSQNRSSVLAAVVLAAITFFTFYTFRDYGPASAVRRFHEDILSGNLRDLQDVCTTPVGSPDVAQLASFLKSLEEGGAVPKMASMDRYPDEVEVLVLYQSNGGSQPFVWVVSRREIGWQVNAVQTLRANPGAQSS
jgi:hypothetical protein